MVKPEASDKADSATKSESKDKINNTITINKELKTLRLTVGLGPGILPDPTDDNKSDLDLESIISEEDGDGPDLDPLGSPGEA